MANKKRIATSVAAVATAAALLLGGTFAWQSVNQTALNEASDVINPGGRLHDDFNGTNKDVYVENFADEEIFARVRLEEYFEIVMNKGTDAETVEVVVGTRTEQTDEDGNVVIDDNGKTVYDKNGAIFTDYTSDGEFGAANVKNDEGETTNSWWSWTTGGETQYLPTFNLNKDSLAADINGTYAGPDGNPDTEEDKYTDYVDYLNDYVVDELVEGAEIYDYDADDVDEGEDAVEGDDIKTVSEDEDGNPITHAITTTANATLMSMDEWMNDYNSEAGPYWVYDTDGWVYWAQPIPGRNEDGSTNATGLLLDGIALNQVMDDSWYYAINVVGQFITADDMGKSDGTGFYDTAAGTTPSANALKLLDAIGVDTTGPVLVSNAEELQNAFDNGEDVIIDGVIETTTAETHEDVRFSYDFLWHDGGTMSGGTLNMNSADSRGLFINNENNWPEDGDGANAATLSDTTINASGVSAVYVQAIDAPVTLENVTITSDNCGLYVNMGEQPVTLKDVTINAAINDTHEGENWFNAAVAVAKPGNVIINSGTYTAESDGYAVYVFNTGGTVTINGGEFNGKLGEDAGNLIIKGGTFDHDPSTFVPEGYVVTENEDDTWTVTKVSEDETSNIVKIYVNKDNNYTASARISSGQVVQIILDDGTTYHDFSAENANWDYWPGVNGSNGGWKECSENDDLTMYSIDMGSFDAISNEEYTFTAYLSDGTPVKVDLLMGGYLVDVNGSKLDTAAANKTNYLSIFNANGSLLDSSDAEVKISPDNSGTISAESNTNYNFSFAPSGNYTGPVEITVIADNLIYKKNILLLADETEIFFKNNELGYAVKGDNHYQGDEVEYFITQGQIVLDIPRTDEAFITTAEGWTVNSDNMDTDSGYDRCIFWAGLISIGYKSNLMEVIYENETLGISESVECDIVPKTGNIIDGPTTVSKNGGVYTYTITNLDPRDRSVEAYIEYGDWERYYPSSLEIHGDGTATVEFDFSDLSAGNYVITVEDFKDYARLDITVTE